jgi:hypothetical protein
MSVFYRYEELPRSGYIRVMTLHPASRLDDHVFCDLETTPLGSSGNYAALSYSWGMDKDGDVSLSCLITISGKALAITQKLFEGLRRIRDQVISKRLWIDAVCINQGDIPERNAQVAQMARVYSCATHVIIWLGEGRSEGQDEAIATLVSYDWIKHMLDTESPATIIDSDGQSLKVLEAFGSLESLVIASYAGAPMFCGLVFAKVDQENPDIAREVSAIISTACRIFMRRYWERRWIVQELYHARPRPLKFAGVPAFSKAWRN